MIDFKLASTKFFDRPVVHAVRDAGRRVLSRFGAFVRSDARRSIKPARRKSASELTPAEAARFHARTRAWAAGRLARKPEPPYRTSRPGDPPFAHGPRSPLKLILFAYDPAEQSVSVGPVAFGRRPGVAPDALEHGGRSVAGYRRPRRIAVLPRPFMAPAFEKNLPHLRRWRNEL